MQLRSGKAKSQQVVTAESSSNLIFRIGHYANLTPEKEDSRIGRRKVDFKKLESEVKKTNAEIRKKIKQRESGKSNS